MADDIDAMLRGEDENTSSASQAGNKTQVSNSGVPLDKGTENIDSEEVEFNSLKGSTQARIKRLIQEKNQLREDLDRRASMSSVPPPPYSGGQPNPDVQDAVNKLDQAGIATKNFVSDEVGRNLANLRWQFELDRLESKYPGEDGRPKFDKDEYFDYIDRHQEYRNYFPEDVYEKMYKEELADWKVQKGSNNSRSPVIKPTRTSVHEEPMTPELIEQRLQEPDGKEWYVKNLSKINNVLGRIGQGS